MSCIQQGPLSFVNLTLFCFFNFDSDEDKLVDLHGFYHGGHKVVETLMFGPTDSVFEPKLDPEFNVQFQQGNHFVILL